MRRKITMIIKAGLVCVIISSVVAYHMLNEDESPKKVASCQGKSENCDENVDHTNIPLKIKTENKKEKLSTEGKHGQNIQTGENTVQKDVKSQDDVIHLSVVACGDRQPEVMVMLKSARLLSRSKLHFHIFAETELHEKFKQDLDKWPEKYKSTVTMTIKPITYPSGESEQKWKNVFKPCATQRLFLPYIMDVDSLIYVDTDILFMRPLEDLWAFFSKFNNTQMAALAPEHEDPGQGWYNRFARHPFYGPLGVNSGVMLMNLTRLREMNWIDRIVEYYNEYKLRITWGDQDLINIFFHYFPQTLYVYPCQWNFRPDHCMYMSNCKPAEKEGVSVLHGSRSYFHIDKQPAFKAIYSALRDYKFGDNLQKSLIGTLKNRLEDTKHTPCGRVGHILISQLEKQVNRLMND